MATPRATARSTTAAATAASCRPTPVPSNSVIWVSEVRPGSLPLITAPIVVAQGFDLVWFGIIVIVVTEIALVTPPVGMNVFVLKAVLPDVPVVRKFKGLAPFIAVDVVRLALLVAFPAITLWLGSTVG